MSGDARTPVEGLEGRDLQEAVALEVMGWSVHSDYTQGLGSHETWEGPDGEVGIIPHWHSEIDAAWEVVEEVGPAWSLDQHRDGGPWTAHLERNIGTYGFDATTAPTAICRAALRAVRASNERSEA